MKYDFPMGRASAENMDDPYFLIGLINRFNNSYQALADTLFEELSWKQIFFMNCIALFENAPTIKDMSELLGCSHQNAKQILLKLEKEKYVRVLPDADDKRKQRIMLTDKANEFCRKYEEKSKQAMHRLFESIDKEQLLITIKVFVKLIQNVEEMREKRK